MEYAVWIVFTVAMMIIEASTTNLVSIWFAFGALGAILAKTLGGGVTTQICTFVLLSGASVAIAWPFIKKYHNGKKEATNESTTSKGRDLIKATPGVKVLIQRYKNRRPINNTEGQRAAEEAKEEDNNIINGVELETRADVVAFLKKNLRRISGKDAISGAQTLARLEGYDRIEEKLEEEKRHFYLPFVSVCRSCPLARVFDDAIKTGV